MSGYIRTAGKKIRRWVFYLLCEISGKIGTFAYWLAHAASHAEEWTSRHRDQP
jgi:hypothetical protein